MDDDDDPILPNPRLNFGLFGLVWFSIDFCLKPPQNGEKKIELESNLKRAEWTGSWKQLHVREVGMDMDPGVDGVTKSRDKRNGEK